jgi:penicillin-binding protein 1A
MGRALKNVPIQTQEAPEGLVALGSGRDRSYIYAENFRPEAPPEDDADGTPPPQPDLSKPPSD